MELKQGSPAVKLDNEDTFNRTLWNWNRRYNAKTMGTRALLIVPYGIETAFRFVVVAIVVYF